MSEWWTYSPANFLMFSARTYYRLFEAQNHALWPGHVIVLAAGVAIMALVMRPNARSGLFAAALLGTGWLVVAGSYFWTRYAEIHTAGRSFAAAFAVQAVALLWVGVYRARFEIPAPTSLRGRAGLALLFFAVFLHPLLGVAIGRPLGQAEIFGLMPDPTTVATAGLLLVMSKSPCWLWVIPVIWSLYSGMTLWTLGAPDAILLPVLVVAALVARLWRPRTEQGKG